MARGEPFGDGLTKTGASRRIEELQECTRRAGGSAS